MVRTIISAVFALFLSVPFVHAWTTGEPGTDTAGWALDDRGNKFFAIGLWGIPEYTFTRTGNDEPQGNETAFRKQASPFNLPVVQSGYQRPYMFRDDKVFMAGCSEYRWSLSSKGYSGDIPLPPDNPPSSGSDISFSRMQAIRTRLDPLAPYLRKNIAEPVRDAFDGAGLIHFLADEPDNGRTGWYWPPELVRACRDAVRVSAPGQLTYIDFGGTIDGNHYFYETLFGPSLKTGTDPQRGECFPGDMSTYRFAFDGTPLHRYRKKLFGGGEWIQNPDSVFAHAFFENISRTARAYRDASDIAGVNSYGVFREYPETAGETVDAIRDGCGPGKPVWQFFDASACAKPRGMRYADYAALVTCQVYTAVIHGATGALFYAFDLDEEARREFWPLMYDLAGTLERRRDLFELPETAHGWDTAYHRPGYDHIHYSIRAGSQAVRWLIASNTDRFEPHTVRVEGFPERELPPLGVVILRGQE